MATVVKKSHELTLKDRLSRLNFTQACKLLGEEGAKLIKAGGQYDIDVEDQVYLGNDLFRLRLPGDPPDFEPAIVTITLMAEARNRLHWNCTKCETVCRHVGAAFSLILEEKMALGLAAPPPERKPVESLSEEELIQRALAEREERARTERMRVRSLDPSRPWTDYLVTSAVSGKTYRVALRGEERGKSFCSCPDFRTNTLGTCKHIMHVLRKVKRRFPAKELKKPYRRKHFSVAVDYGEKLSLRLLTPERLQPDVNGVIGPIRNVPIEDVHELIRRIAKLEQLGHDVTVYPDAEEYIQQRLFQDRIRDLVQDIRKDPARHPLRQSLLKVELLPYQLDGIAFAVGAGRAILADDMGLGKSIQGIGVAELLAREAGIRKVLVICPASLKSQWRNEISKFCERDCQLVMGSAKVRAAQYDNQAFFTICNYEQVLRDYLAIERVKWDLIILDEGQRIKNWEAKTSRIVKSLRSPFALVLSGTPLENRLDELYSVVEFIDDRRLAPAFRFFNRHRVVDEKGKVLGYKNLTELRENLKPILLRRTRQQVMNQLPPRTTEIIRIAPTDEQKELHRAHMRVVSSIVNKRFLTEMDLLRLRQALQACRMAANSTFLVDKQEPGHSSKLEVLEDLLDRLFQEEGRKVVLFSEWMTMLNLIEGILKKLKLDYVRLDGSVPQRQRQALVHRFQNNPDCRLFLTTNAGSTGLNLQAANTVINVDLPWNPAVLEQRIARAHRMGQKQPVQVYLLVTEETIEENLLGTLSAKHELFLAALDPDSDIDQVDMASGLEELKRRLEVLLGAKPEAAKDESVQRARAEEARRLAHRQKVAEAGGQLLTAAFQFLGTLIPEADGTDSSKPAAPSPAADELKRLLGECLEENENGQPQLTITLPDRSALDTLAESLARLLSLRPPA
ncbi:MAG: DEAD/DEAH box helicase [Planctomycetes bacterium]|nr:DEAD/DEAH box helicase [Planctomycetota bacterium]